MSTQFVSSFRKDLTYSRREPCIAALLSCGHYGKAVLRPTLYACSACGAESTTCQHGSCPCGSTSGGFRIAFIADAHNDAHVVTKVGEAVNCEQCDTERTVREEVIAALLSPKLTHTRYRDWGYGIVTVYHRDETSPTGVLAAAGCDVKLFDRISAELKAAGRTIRGGSPLSPTEGLGVNR